jgi:hypothetical protein
MKKVFTTLQHITGKYTMKFNSLPCILLFTCFIALNTNALEQVHNGVKAVQPNEYEIFKRWDKRQHLQGVWNLFKVEFTRGISFEDLKEKLYEWWKKESKVYINDQLVTSHKNLFIQALHLDATHLEDFEVDITKYLNRNSTNTLNVLVFAGPKVKVWGGLPTDLAGINGPVWIDYHSSETLIKNVFLTPYLNRMFLNIEFKRDSVEESEKT